MGLIKFAQHKLNLKEESLSPTFLTYASMFKMFTSNTQNNLYGVTGTIGEKNDAQRFLKNFYNVDIVFSPSFNKNLSISYPPILVNNEQEWINQIIEVVNKEAKKGRGILIINEGIKISEKIYKEIYQKNQFIPEINNMGDIIIDITKIIEYLDTFSDSKQLKIHRRIKKIHKIPPKPKNIDNIMVQNKFFHINNSKSNYNSNAIPLDEDFLEGRIINKTIFEEKENLSHSIGDNESDINDNNKQNDKTLLNIKRKLKNISISKPNNDPFDNKMKFKIFNLSNNSIEDKIFNFKNDTNEKDIGLNKDINKEIMPLSNDIQYKTSKPNQLDFKFGENSDNNNIFNFSLNEIHDLSNNIQKNNLNIFTPLMNKEVNNNLILSPEKPLFSPYNVSSMKFNSLLSPNFSINSPYNANMFNNAFNFRNNEFNDTIDENNNAIYNTNEKIDNENDKKEKKEK